MQAGKYHFVVTLNLGPVTATRDGEILVLEGATREGVYNEVVDRAVAAIEGDADDGALSFPEPPIVIFFDVQPQ